MRATNCIDATVAGDSYINALRDVNCPSILALFIGTNTPILLVRDSTNPSKVTGRYIAIDPPVLRA